MPQVNKITIEINGTKYPISSTEEPAYVKELAEELNRTLAQLMAGSKGLSLNESMILIALSYLDQYRKTEVAADNLRSQIREYLEEAAGARKEAVEAKKEADRLRKELETLEEMLLESGEEPDRKGKEPKGETVK